MAAQTTIVPAALAGRCANGFERGQGRVIHALPSTDGRNVATYARSLCGKTHGARSAGWSLRLDGAVTCPRCITASKSHGVTNG